ncbi:MAG: hypothetical protein ABI178_16495 [Rhodanobacter sp.]
MRIKQLLTALLVTGLLSACGSSGKPGTATPGARADTTATPSGNASAKEVAAAARGDVKCPAHSVAAPAGAPVDDVLGVRPGMTYQQAANAVMCSNPLLVITPENGRGFQIQTYGQTIRQGFSARFAAARVQKTGRDYAREMEQEAMERGLNVARHDMKPGQSKWFVSTMGIPGQEKVIGAAREDWFAESRNPTMDSVEQALINKYGTPTQKTDQDSYHQLRWAYDPRGRLITDTSPLYNKCRGVADPDGGMGLSADCGVIVEAAIQSLRSNPALAQLLQAGVVDQAGGYQALTDTKQVLQTMDAARRAKQVQDASKNAQAPQL